MPFERRLISKVAHAASLWILIAVLHVSAHGGGKVVGPKVSTVTGGTATPVTVRMVLIQVESPDCCKPCKKRGDPCDKCCSLGTRIAATNVSPTDDWRPQLENVPDGSYLVTIEVDGKPTIYFDKPLVVKSGKTSKIGGEVTVEVAPAARDAVASP